MRPDEVTELADFVGNWQEMTLPNGMKLQWKVEPWKQQLASSSDELMATCEIRLPCEPNGNLAIELQFNRRLSLLGEDLVTTWGNIKTTWRHKWKESLGKTWAEALTQCHLRVTAEINNLCDIINKRIEALHSEGCEFAVAAEIIKGINGDKT